LHAHAPVLTRPEQTVRVGKQRLELDGAGAGPDLAIGRHDHPAMRVLRAVGQPQGQPGVAGLGAPALVERGELLLRPREIAIAERLEDRSALQVVALAEREPHPDRIELRHRGE
jgi:hypothetical protein